MATLSKPPPARPIKPLPPVKAQSAALKEDVGGRGRGSSPPAAEANPAQEQRAKIRTLPDVPMHATKHANPAGRPRNRNEA